jgi:hypothetical protein
VHEDCRHAVVVSRRNGLNKIVIDNTTETFVVEDDVVLLRPAYVTIDRNLVVATSATFVDDIPRNVDSLAHAFGNDSFLIFVVVATATRDQQSLKRLRLFRRQDTYAAGADEQWGKQNSKNAESHFVTCQLNEANIDSP